MICGKGPREQSCIIYLIYFRAKIFKLQAQIIAHDMEMSNDEAQEYQVSFSMVKINVSDNPRVCLETSDRLQRFPIGHCRFSRRLPVDERRQVNHLLTHFRDRSFDGRFYPRFEDAITYFCVACEYNLRLSKQCTLPMRGMDSCLLFKARRLCFEVGIRRVHRRLSLIQILFRRLAMERCG